MVARFLSFDIFLVLEWIWGVEWGYFGLPCDDPRNMHLLNMVSQLTCSAIISSIIFFWAAFFASTALTRSSLSSSLPPPVSGPLLPRRAPRPLLSPPTALGLSLHLSGDRWPPAGAGWELSASAQMSPRMCNGREGDGVLEGGRSWFAEPLEEVRGALGLVTLTHDMLFEEQRVCQEREAAAHA